MQDAKEAKIIGWASDVSEFSTSGIYTTDKVLRARRAVLVRFLRANLRATKEYSKAFLETRDSNGQFVPSPLADELVAILAKTVNLDPKTVRSTVPYINPTSQLNPDDIATQIATWQGVGMVSPGVSGKQIVDTSPMEEASK